jgi:hypothetical protein
MSINYIPFESKSGFKSPGFAVSENGDITVDGKVQFNNQFNVAPDFTVNGILVIDNSDSVVSLGDQIKNSSLTRVGTLEFLNIEGDLVISQGSTPYFNIENGHVEMISINGTGSIENMDIGLKEPADANFKSVNIGPGDSTGELTVQGNIGVTQDINVGGELSIGGDLSVNGDISINDLPTESNHATRKDYVDSRVAAFAIAFGA